MRLLLQGFDLDLPPGKLDGRGQVAAPLVVLHQSWQYLHHLALQVFALEGSPFLEGSAIGQEKIAQEAPVVQVGHRFHVPQTGKTSVAMAVAVRPHSLR